VVTIDVGKQATEIEVIVMGMLAVTVVEPDVIVFAF